MSRTCGVLSTRFSDGRAPGEKIDFFKKKGSAPLLVDNC